MAQFPIGPSSYGDLKGVMQYVNTQRIADQFNSLALEYDTQIAQNGERLSANEGMRSRPRQTLLYSNFLRTGYPIAARPFTSRHDEVYHGNAIDVGVTMANGQNRALTPSEFDWMHAQAERRGFTWTGRYFNEPWHIEGATRAEQLPPYPGVRIANSYIAPPEPEAPPVVKAPDPKIEDDMLYVRSDKGNKQYYVIGETTVLAVSPARARVYAQAVRGEGNLFQTLTSGAVSALIADARTRRKQANLPVLAAIEEALTVEDKPEE